MTQFASAKELNDFFLAHPGLTDLSVTDSPLTNDDLQNVSWPETLAILTFERCPGITAVRHLRAAGLRRFTVTECDGVERILGVPPVNYFRAGGLPKLISLEFPDARDDADFGVYNCPLLGSMSAVPFGVVKFSIAGLPKLKRLPNTSAREVTISSCLSLESFQGLQPGVVKLRAHNCPGLMPFQNQWPGTLEELVLYRCSATELAGLPPGLTDLKTYDANIEKIMVGGLAIEHYRVPPRREGL